MDKTIILPVDAQSDDVAPQRPDAMQQVPVSVAAANPITPYCDGCGMFENECACSRINDSVDHPPHYAAGRKYEPIDVIEDWDLTYHLGSVVKYVSRAGRKGDAATDLKKARVHLNREIDRLERV